MVKERKEIGRKAMVGRGQDAPGVSCGTEWRLTADRNTFGEMLLKLVNAVRSFRIACFRFKSYGSYSSSIGYGILN